MEAIEDSSTYKEIPRSRTNSLSLCTDERSNFQSVINKLEHEVKNLKSKLNESGNYYLVILCYKYFTNYSFSYFIKSFFFKLYLNQLYSKYF